MNANWILNEDGSIYHLHLLPDQVSDCLILVGDPDRVAKVSKYFDNIEYRQQAREFVSCTGSFKNKRMTVLSTGIGADNIDIALTEYDALLNVDLVTGKALEKNTSIDIIRLGTSGSIQKDIGVDEILLSAWGIDSNPVMHYYIPVEPGTTEISDDFKDVGINITQAFLSSADTLLLKKFSQGIKNIGCTYTASGFYGPQGRNTRIPQQMPDLMTRLSNFRHPIFHRITNLEMETGTLYAFAHAMGHRALSINAILANRQNNTFSENPSFSIEKMICLFFDLII